MKFFFTLFTFFLLCTSLYGQKVDGNVTDEYGLDVLGALIANKTNNQHTHTDDDGRFEIMQTKLGDTLIISHIGYKDKLYIVNTIDQPLTIKLTELSFSLGEVVVTNKVDALQLVSDIDLEFNPVNTSQDVLRKVPGLFIGQHAGGGKAEQIFLRGFDIDHGTDINITVDGLPVNMVSHAHGQGYADLHFLIPETIDRVDFGKGPYYADQGNFNTAGYVGFETKKRLDNSLLRLEVGQFDTQRLLGMFNLLNTKNQSAYIATEYTNTDGPFDSPQNFNRINLLGKFSSTINNKDRIDLTTSYLFSKWDASGQIPERAIASGLIDRFGAIDDTEGGETSRTNVLMHYTKFIDETTSIKNTAYYSNYNFELYSNFTFFLEDPVNGDQIRQNEGRNIVGLNSEYNKSFKHDYIDGLLAAGISFRNDSSMDNELSRTANRNTTLEQLQFGDINETNIGAYTGVKFDINKWTINPIVRFDYFKFQYNDDLLPFFQTQANSETIISPKLNVLYNQTENLQLYIKTGKGFHSNDTRVVVAENGMEILPAAYGFDVGYIWKPTRNMFINMAYWYLFLEQEFVYVGDAGIVEPSGRSRRQGVELSYRYQPLPSFFWNLDVNYTHARSIDEAEGQDFIPLAPDLTLVSSLNFKHKSGLYGSAHLRYIDDRPANEDDSINAEGYTVIDFNAGYKLKNVDFGFRIENLLNVDWKETQFATESRLQDEQFPVEEIHFTPGTRFNFRGFLQYNF